MREWYNYRQNNSGGCWDGPARYVSIKAHSVDQANDIAESIGVYFNGCNDHIDCPCCGDRWDRPWASAAKKDGPSSYDDDASWIQIKVKSDGLKVRHVRMSDKESANVDAKALVYSQTYFGV